MKHEFSEHSGFFQCPHVRPALHHKDMSCTKDFFERAIKLLY